MIHRIVAHFELLELLGSGAMGSVYKARDLKLDREVAIKFISGEHASDSTRRARFLQEAKAASMLDHQNICTIYEVEETSEGELFIVMAYCEGHTLREYLEQRLLDVSEAVDIGTQTAAGLYKAHRTGVIHRDIKPGNVMITTDGVAKIVDFGLAKVRGFDSTLTTTGSVMGTLAYMSPEQIRGEVIDHRSDIWSWGVMFYEMLSGTRPFRGASGYEVSHSIVSDVPIRPSALRHEVPEALDRIVMQALQKNPRDRQQSGRELCDQLGATSRQTSAVEIHNDSAGTESVAVLPFVNVQSDPDSDYFSDGLTEELINALSRVPNLRVVARTSAFEFKGKSQNISAIAQQLKVRTVVEGSVRKFRDTLRVSAHLVNATNGYCLWSEKFDRTMNDVFAIQDEIATSVAQALEVRLRPEGQSSGTRPRQTRSMEAYDACLRGRFQWNKRSGEGLQQALECFEKALQFDRNYAAAYSGIADYHIAVASWGLERPSEAWPKAKAAALRALSLDEKLAEAHASLGTVRMWGDWDWADAEREFLRAINRNQGHPNAHIQYNVMLVQTGRFNEAEDQIRSVLETDPLSIRANSYLAGLFHYRREYDRSLEQCQRTLQLDPDDIELHVVMGLNYEQKKMYREAIRELELARKLADNNPIIFGPLGSCYAQCGEENEAVALLAESERASEVMYVAAITRAMIFLGMKDLKNAFEWLNRAADAREVLLCYLVVGPIYDGIRHDPRYQELVNRIGLQERRRHAA